MSRNQDRFGGPLQSDTTPPQGGGFSFVVPTEFVELPSRGKYYPPTHPLHGQTTLEFKQMTAKEEDILTSRALLKKGIVLERVMESVIVDKTIQPSQMFVGDRNALVIALRAAAYGRMYNTEVTCPNCQHKQSHSFDLVQKKLTGFEHDEQIVDNGDSTFNVITPFTKVDVRFKLLIGEDERNILQGLEMDKKQEVEKNISRHLSTMLVSVNGFSDARSINLYVQGAPASEARFIRECYKKVNPDVDLTQEFTCSECGHERSMEVPLSVDFFWPNG